MGGEAGIEAGRIKPFYPVTADKAQAMICNRNFPVERPVDPNVCRQADTGRDARRGALVA
jgi:hypothetical protein